MKRYRIQPTHFDTRAHILEEPKDTWTKEAVELHIQNKERLTNQLKFELGEYNFEQKLENFKELGPIPFSVVSHHNGLFEQARYAFIHCQYYPALTAACALGERILNHLLLDLRDHYPVSSFDKKSHRRKSIDDWKKAISTFREWGIWKSDEVTKAFRDLSDLRHRSIHFNVDTTKNLRCDALSSLEYLSTIIGEQFGFRFDKTIPGTRGAFFLKKEEEADPFVREYYLAQSFYVSPYHAFEMIESVWCLFDYKQPDDDIDDEEFARLFNNRTSDQVTPTSVPWDDSIVVYAAIDNKIHELEYVAPSVEASETKEPQINIES